VYNVTLGEWESSSSHLYTFPVTLANNRSRLFLSGFPNKFVVGEMADRCFGNADDDDDDDGIEVIIAVDLSSRRRGCG
jgi:hypothetical protein